MPTHIVVNSLGLTYKGTIGVSIATIPDVCKTPTPGGPVPLPYPNFANQGTLKDGTTTVFAKGGKMIAIKGSQYGMSTGDEPGTVGGVKSNVFKKATDWITYSFDVKMDGKNACRHTDKKFHNDKNTVNLAGDLDPAVAARGIEKLKDILCECNRQVDAKQAQLKASNQKMMNCKELGDAKHKCCDDAVKKVGGEPKFDPEKGYDEKTGKHDPSASREWPSGMEATDYFAGISGKIFPDAAMLNPDGSINRFVEYKFRCPAGTPTGKTKGGKRKKPSQGTADTSWTPAKKNKKGKITKQDQRTRTIKLGAKQNPKVKNPPELLTNKRCKK
ncbi:DUF4150 domain-containing protein [Mesorhizobium sp. M0494]|uniref:DUF4150 domain-containing protein n=1 Tax=unclassified Mesorhizobium TaxID=325217 RepID=UPI00333B9FC0